jgi:hypothetical protein
MCLLFEEVFQRYLLFRCIKRSCQPLAEPNTSELKNHTIPMNCPLGFTTWNQIGHGTSLTSKPQDTWRLPPHVQSYFFSRIWPLLDVVWESIGFLSCKMCRKVTVELGFYNCRNALCHSVLDCFWSNKKRSLEPEYLCILLCQSQMSKV